VSDLPFRANAAEDQKVISYPTEKGEEKHMNTKQMVSVAAGLIRLGGDQVMRRSVLSAWAVVLAVVAGAADASTVVYDSTWVYAAGTTYPNPPGGIVRHPTQAYLASQSIEYGSKVALAGSNRLAQSAKVQMRSGGGGVDESVTMTLKFYSLTSGSNVGSLVGSRTQTFVIPGGDPDAGLAIPPAPADSDNFWVTRPWFDVTFDLSALNLTLPDQLAWGLEFDGLENTAANSLNINMWNYGTANNWTEPRLVDGSPVKTGTVLVDTWRRQYDGGGGYAGNLVLQESMYVGQFTPSIAITAVPEPSTYAMALAGLACGGYLVRRCRKQA